MLLELRTGKKLAIINNMKNHHKIVSRLISACLGLAVFAPTVPSQAVTIIYSAAGANAAAIQATVDSFRADLGTLNPNTPGSVGTGRREINWDGVPDSFASPNALPGNFFNVNSARGVVFSTPGTGFQVSANSGVVPIEFGNIDPNYPAFFATFSAQRLFTPIGSNILDVTFFIPGSTDAALTRGFGAVFSDVDLASTTSIEYFDAANASLGSFYTPNAPGNETLAFLGVTFDDPVISRVRITNGNQILAAGNTGNDLVVMDDFIYGEPVARAVPEPMSTLVGLLLAILPLLAWVRLQRTA